MKGCGVDYCLCGRGLPLSAHCHPWTIHTHVIRKEAQIPLNEIEVGYCNYLTIINWYGLGKVDQSKKIAFGLTR